MRRAPFLVPALLCFPGAAARQDAWGRLLSITAGGGELSTAARLTAGDRVLVRFSLGGEDLILAARVSRAENDDDGHRLAELRWIDMVERRRLSRVLLDVLSRA
ncbi:MAG: PilZ domain-containing protein [Elusimicrobia bacterium]|nr:PilZ domain-containing protein [Elusimicrobiota bacterium]